MIILGKNIKDNTTFSADYCIIGGGPAGLTLATSLAKNKTVLVIAGGNPKETEFNRRLNMGEVSPKNSHEPIEKQRRRTFGGSSLAWGGRCIPFDPIDFEKRPYIPNSGWPIEYKDLEPYYKTANQLCEVGEFDYQVSSTFKNKPQEIIGNFDDENLSSQYLEKWSTPVNFGKKHQEQLDKSKRITVLFDTHATKLNIDKNTKRINSITAITSQHKNVWISADNFILAAGGIENPRLLLVSKNNEQPKGIGNENDVVGRYYMAHLDGICTTVSIKDKKNLLIDFEKDNDQIYCRRRWWVTEKAQKRLEIGNSIFFLHSADGRYGYNDPIVSFRFLGKSVIRFFKREASHKDLSMNNHNNKKITGHLINVVRNGIPMLPMIVKMAFYRLKKRRLPFLLPSKNSSSLGLYFQTEQVPNYNSRVTLSKTCFDSFGNAQANVAIKFSKKDIETVEKAHELFFKKFEAGKFGDYNFSKSDLNEYLQNDIAAFNSGSHQLGTTRMASDPKLGVVDKNCKVFDIENLYVAGSSVFPTGGHANPTLTIVALTLRLASHLNSLHKIGTTIEKK